MARDSECQEPSDGYMYDEPVGPEMMVAMDVIDLTCPPEPDPVIMGLLREGGVMRKSRFTEEQIIAILAESDAGAQTSDLCRRHGISANTFYRWRKKYGGMDVSEARRLKQLEDENARLKRIVADQALNLQVLKDLLGNK